MVEVALVSRLRVKHETVSVRDSESSKIHLKGEGKSVRLRLIPASIVLAVDSDFQKRENPETGTFDDFQDRSHLSRNTCRASL